MKWSSRLALPLLPLLLALPLAGRGPAVMAAASGLAWALLLAARCRTAVSLLAPLLLGLALIGLYLANPSHHWVEGLGLVPRRALPLLPATASRADTLDAFLLAVALSGAFMLGAALRRRDLPKLAWLAVATGACMSLLVLWQRLMPKRFPVFEYTGVFVSENHFAAFANLVVPVALAVGSLTRLAALREGRVSSPSGLAYLAAVLMAAAILVSRSRAGAFLLVASGLGWAVFQFRLRKAHPFLFPRLGRLKMAGAAVLLLALVVVGTARVVGEWSHWRSAHGELSFRAALLGETVAMWASRPTWGTGPGTFAIVHPYYRSGRHGGIQASHAHCDPLQMLAEWGWLGICWVGACGFWAVRLRGAWGGAGLRGVPERAIWFAAFGLGLVSLALHSGVDFPFRQPAIALFAAVWAGLLCALASPSSAQGSRSSSAAPAYSSPSEVPTRRAVSSQG